MTDMGAGFGMLTVATIGKIRRAYFAQEKPIKAICREFRVSRKVVRKVVRSQATEFRYKRGHQPPRRIDPWRKQLDDLLLANEGKPRRERLTLIRVFEEPRGLGIPGRLRCGTAPCPEVARRARCGDRTSLRAAALCAGRSLPVRLEP
jgi:hypothetical protein